MLTLCGQWTFKPQVLLLHMTALIHEVKPL